MASVTIRYARAFVDVVLDTRLDAATALEELRALGAVLDQSAPLRLVWESPAIPAEQKRKVLDGLAAKLKLSKPVRNLVAVLIDHRRITLYPQVVRQFEAELNERLGFTQAEIISTRQLSDAERRRLEQQIEKLTGRKVRARYAQDGSILGGAIVRVGSTIYDGSIRGQLTRIKELLAAGS
jgi:F-type H+-transporting ATPase subunit delta